MEEFSPFHPVHAAIFAMDPIDLVDLQVTADLQTRLDRKYILEPGQAAEVIRKLTPTMKVLDIDGRRTFAYETVYFDTPGLDSYFGSAYGRRQRFKVRTRSYLDSNTCVLEVKTTGGRGHTVKERRPYDMNSRTALSAAAREFLQANEIPDSVIGKLSPTLTTRYQRTTLMDLNGARFTIDSELSCQGRTGAITGLPSKVLVETKALGAGTEMDRLLWANGRRPVAVSKYCTGLAAITPGLPANKWNLTLRRHFDWSPQRRAGMVAGG